MTDHQLLIERRRDALKQGLVTLSDEIATRIHDSLEALRQRDLELARKLVTGDSAIDQQRRLLEQQALVVLAAYQPAGRQIRVIGASLEMISELERIADYAADVAEILLTHEGTPLPERFVARILELGTLAHGMFCDVMRAYAMDDTGPITQAAIAPEATVDALEQELIQEVMAWICHHPQEARAGMDLLWLAHHYERMADRSTNLAERILYIATGETVDLD